VNRGTIKRGFTVYENLKKGGVVEKRGEEETKSMPHAPVHVIRFKTPLISKYLSNNFT
jgi:hypothetical protein